MKLMNLVSNTETSLQQVLNKSYKVLIVLTTSVWAIVIYPVLQVH